MNVVDGLLQSGQSMSLWVTMIIRRRSFARRTTGRPALARRTRSPGDEPDEARVRAHFTTGALHTPTSSARSAQGGQGLGRDPSLVQHRRDGTVPSLVDHHGRARPACRPILDQVGWHISDRIGRRARKDADATPGLAGCRRATLAMARGLPPGGRHGGDAEFDHIVRQIRRGT